MGLLDTAIQGTLDYLTEEQPRANTATQEIKQKAGFLIGLYKEMKLAEEAFQHAKQKYEAYAYTVLPSEMRMNGIELIKTTQGDVVRIATKYYCSPNKNEADRALIREWLKNHSGDHLVKERYVVPQEAVERLEAANIPFDIESEVNTNSLKAWIKGMLGVNGMEAKISVEDIPNCIHFMERDEAEVVEL
jgi:hypothetical protein